MRDLFAGLVSVTMTCLGYLVFARNGLAARISEGVYKCEYRCRSPRAC